MKTFAVGVVALMALVFAAFAVKPDQSVMAQPENEEVTEQVEAQPSDEADEERYVYIQMKTSKGDLFLELDEKLAPISTANFVRYAEEEFYNGTIFHRVISNFMIQGGGFDQDMKKKKTHEGIKNEWENGLSNTRGSIAMARLGNQPDSATAQFFINVADNGFLDTPRDGAGYAVFGKVVKGMDVVDAIRTVQTTTKGPYGDVPVEPVVIEKVTVLEQAKAEELGLVEADG
ncbi:MAG: peptidylprolyl isomerase [Phycisphaerales bacterium]